MWTKLLFAILVYTYAGTVNAIATDATWFCSAIINRAAAKPNVFKFVVTGRELIDPLEEDNRVIDKYYPPKPGERREPLATKYNIVEETNIGLIAERHDTDNPIGIQVILINKTSGAFVLGGLTTKEKDSTYYEGTCQVGK